MVFDANLVLADDTLDWDYENLNTQDYGTPTSTTKNSGGFVILDIKETAAKGMSVIFFADQAGVGTDDALTLLLQASDSPTFASGIQTLCNFEVAGVSHGVILGNETPCTVIRRFHTNKRYLRVDASCTTSDDFYTCWVVLAPWPFYL